jgi:ribosomal protein S18 acetylase RimI-like enzyme
MTTDGTVAIRRIAEDEGDTVGGLWDRMCREIEDGGPLTPRGLRRLSRMLAMSAWHRDAFCLVAVRDAAIVGFVNGRVTTDEGLLPGLCGEIDSLYVVPEERHRGISRALAEAALGHLREQGADPIRYHSCADATEDHRFWESLGFEADQVRLTRYRHG